MMIVGEYRISDVDALLLREDPQDFFASDFLAAAEPPRQYPRPRPPRYLRRSASASGPVAGMISEHWTGQGYGVGGQGPPLAVAPGGGFPPLDLDHPGPPGISFGTAVGPAVGPAPAQQSGGTGHFIDPGGLENPVDITLFPNPAEGPTAMPPPPPGDGEGIIIYGVEGQWIRLRPGHTLGRPHPGSGTGHPPPS
jgi:hypothetical protein